MKILKTTTVLGLYGNCKLVRGYCYRCRGTAFVLDGKLACCGWKFQDEPKKVMRMAGTGDKRKSPGKRVRNRLLQQYEWSCAYCERRFGSYVQYHGKDTKVTLHWDHQVPFKYNQDNSADNFLPACRFCNLWKHAKIFQTIDEVRIYMHGKWMEHDKEEASRWKSNVSNSENKEKQKNVPVEKDLP